MHALVIDSETSAVLIDQKLDGTKPAVNKDAIGTYSGPGTMHGPVYVGVSIQCAPATKVHDWEPDADAVFIEWEDRSSSEAIESSIVHRVERPLPGGGIGRFLVTISG